VGLLLAGCEATLHFNECTQDTDCAGRVDGGTAYCTNDHFCVGSVPDERLCTNGIFPPQPAADAVYIGGFFHFSGATGVGQDPEIAKAAQLAIEQIATVAPRPVAIVMCDTVDGGDVVPRSLDVAIQKYNIVAVVGPTTSDDVLGIASEAVAKGILVISPSATSPAISSLSDANLIWRTCGSDSLQAATLSSLIPTMVTGRPTVVSVAYANDSAYATGLKTAFVSDWSTTSGIAPKSTIGFATGSSPVDVVTRLAADTPDFALIIADADADGIMTALYSEPGGLTGTQFLWTDAAEGLGLFGATPDVNVLNRTRGTAPATPSTADPIFANFRLDFMDRFGTDPLATAFTANAFDAAFLAALAINSVPSGPVTPSALVSAMTRVSTTGAQAIQCKPATDFVLGATTLAQGNSIDITGASGKLTFDANGDVTDAPITVWGVNTTLTPPQFCDLPTGMLPCP
jgi:branched-chain amino acid transport system substrate-binding protein